jgi:hypothetical protein
MKVRKVILAGRALAFLVLGVAMLRVVFHRMMGRKTGLPLFRENYDADRLPPLLPSERRAMERWSGCIACGRCDEGEGERIAKSNGAYPGLMALVLASSRSMPDHDAASIGFGFVPVEVLRAKRKTCPVEIPFEEISAFVSSTSASVSRAS